MKTRIFLVLSLCLNVVLAAAYWFKPVATGEIAEVQHNNSSLEPALLPASAEASPTPQTETSRIFDWRVVESEDYRQYIANLRAIGCPEETIRDIIVADVGNLYDSRRRQMRAASTNQFEFWKSSHMFGSLTDEEAIRRQQELAQEKRELLEELLGAAPEEKPDMTAMLHSIEEMLDFLPENKQVKILEMMQTYQARVMQSFTGGAPDIEDMKEIRRVQKEMESAMAEVLTPAEMEEYQLRLSETAVFMRLNLAAFEADEQEFRAIFKLQKQFDDEHGLMGMFLSGEPEKLQAAQNDLQASIKQVLGEPRFADYERSMDWAYQGIAKVVERQGLPKQTAVQVYDMKKIAEAETQRIQSDPALSQEQRNAALRAIRAETEAAIIEVMGQTGFQSYQSQPGAFWLKTISPDPR